MDKNTGNGAPRPHIDTLRVVYGHAFAITPTGSVPLPRIGERNLDHRDEVSP